MPLPDGWERERASEREITRSANRTSPAVKIRTKNRTEGRLGPKSTTTKGAMAAMVIPTRTIEKCGVLANVAVTNGTPHKSTAGLMAYMVPFGTPVPNVRIKNLGNIPPSRFL
jgi:hypothetical protein